MKYHSLLSQEREVGMVATSRMVYKMDEWTVYWGDKMKESSGNLGESDTSFQKKLIFEMHFSEISHIKE